MKDYRTRYEIIYKILDIVYQEGTQTRTGIMYGARMSYKQTQEYESLLLDKGFIERIVENSQILFRISSKGKQYMESFILLEKLMKA